MRNNATEDDIDPRYLKFLEATDSIMAIPLVCRSTVWGICSIELPVSGKLSFEIKELLELLSNSIAPIIWKADAWKFNQRQTAQVISRFTASIGQIDDTVIEELEKLSLTLDFMTAEDAERIILGINTKLASMLGAHIIDVLWKQEGRESVLLHPFSSFDRTPRMGAKPYEIRESDDDQTGVWSWVYKHCKPLWIENIRRRDLGQLVTNEATEDQIEPRYMNFLGATDSIMAIPLVCRGTVSGIYSVEFPDSGRLTREISMVLDRIAGAFATIIWKADAQTFSKEHRSEAVRRFCASWQEYKVENLITRHRQGLIIRPFETKFNVIGDCIRQFFEKNYIKAEHFRYDPGRVSYVIDDIMDKIGFSHFGIVDITGCNFNVMLELGMMMILQKKIILLRRDDDDTDVPFDISNYHHYVYQERPGKEIWIQDPGTSHYEPIERVLGSFITSLENDPAFRAAKRWIGS